MVRGECTDPPFELDDFLNCIVFECIYRSHRGNDITKSFRRHMIDNGEKYNEPAHTQITRTMEKAQQNREERFGQLNRLYGLEPEQLLRQSSFAKMEERKKGHQLTDIQYRQAKNIERLTILKKIDSKQICDSNHYSNARLTKDVREYEEHFEKVFSSVQTSENYIQASIELFSIEEHYFIEFAYALSTALAKKAKSKVKYEIPGEAISLLCNAAHSSMRIMTNSRFVVNRLKLIPYILEEGNWEIIRLKILRYLSAKVCLFHSDVFGQKEDLVSFFTNNICIDEQAKFISNDYKICDIIQEKEWTEDRMRFFRRIYNTVVRDGNTRKNDLTIGSGWHSKK